MKKILISLVVLSFYFGATAQEENALLWKVSGNGIESPSYLYGTIHFICPDDFKMEESVKNAFDQTAQLFLEIDFDDPAMMGEMQQELMMKDGKSATDFLDEKSFQSLDKFFTDNIGISLKQVSTMKPFALMSLMIIPLTGCQPKSFETEFVQMASQKGSEVLGLESVKYQMGLFDSIPYQKQYDMLVKMAASPKEATEEFKQMTDAYKNHDLSALSVMMDDSEWDYRGYEDLLIYTRNANWIPLIEKAAKESPTFFAFGAGHLPGKKGVINLLKQAGYKIEPVN